MMDATRLDNVLSQPDGSESKLNIIIARYQINKVNRYVRTNLNINARNASKNVLVSLFLSLYVNLAFAKYENNEAIRKANSVDVPIDM